MAPAPSYCAERELLTREAFAAVSDLYTLLAEQLQYVMGDQAPRKSMKREIRDATQKKKDAKAALAQHVEEHACGR